MISRKKFFGPVSDECLSNGSDYHHGQVYNIRSIDVWWVGCGQRPDRDVLASPPYNGLLVLK